LNPVYKRAQGLTETAMLRHWLSMLLRMPLIHLNLIGVLVGFQSCFKCILVGEKKWFSIGMQLSVPQALSNSYPLCSKIKNSQVNEV
jgi:hypothetical protein